MIAAPTLRPSRTRYSVLVFVYAAAFITYLDRVCMSVAAPAMQARYTRTAQNEIYRQFHRLPNPDLVMYVFPHLAGTDPVPVPGYSTVFPLYQRVQYALPGERVEDY